MDDRCADDQLGLPFDAAAPPASPPLPFSPTATKDASSAAAGASAAAAPRAAVSAAPGLHVLRHVPPAGHRGSGCAELGRRV